ncbi:tRNA pseudouridine synthase A [Moraxella caviae]|nr:tRNA pseudouridine synthase A [Moraxella caviae]
MVRNLMGALFAVGQGELNKDELLAIMHAKDRSLAPPTASADGLYFINAYYPERFQSLLPDAP